MARVKIGNLQGFGKRDEPLYILAMTIGTLTTRLKQSAGYRLGRCSDLAYQAVERNSIYLRQQFEAFRGRRNLQRRFPELANYECLATTNRELLQPYYDLYISQFSDPGWAVSLELSIFLLTLCKLLKPKTLLDTGSGFSSFVFRYHAAHASPTPEVWSVDDDPEWLETTLVFLRQHGLATDNVGQWQTFKRANPGKFDLILHDLAFGQRRMEELNPILDLRQPTGVVVLDDIHIESYHGYAMNILKKRRLHHDSLRSFTLDNFNRYAEIVYLNQNRKRSQESGGAKLSWV